MQTELLYKYDLEEGAEISRFLPIDQDNFLILVSENISGKKRFSLNIEGDKASKIRVATDPKPHDLNFFTSLFKYKSGFGLMEYTGRLSLWESLTGNCKKFTIKNPFPTENEFVKGFTSSISHNGDDFLIGIEESVSYGFPAKFWAPLALKPKSFLGIPLPLNTPVMGKLYALDLSNYPKTSRHPFSEGEWLNILALLKKDDYIFVHTNGGAATRSKSGPGSEFSILSVLDSANNLIRNVEIEKGKGYFSTDKEYFILHSHKNKRKLLFYSLQSYEAEFEVSISDQDEIKSKFVFFDLYRDRLYVYGKDFLHIRRLLW